MKHIPCLICLAEQNLPLLTNTKDPFLKNLNKASIQFVVCERCGFVFQNPALEEKEIEKLYATDNYDQPNRNISEKYKTKKEEYALQTFEWIKKQLVLQNKFHKSKILDIGSNTGALLSFFKKREWDCVGIEPSANMSRIANKRYGIPDIITQLFQKDMFKNDSFDLVTLVHTLEHLKNPSEILAAISKTLTQNGILYVEVPNIFKPKSSFYTSYFAAPHLYVFSHNSLQRLLSKNGFEVVAKGDLPRGICTLAKKIDPIDLTLIDSPSEIFSCISAYKQKHDRDTFIYRYIANSMSARIMIKLRVPVISKACSRFRERIRINKTI